MLRDDHRAEPRDRVVSVMRKSGVADLVPYLTVAWPVHYGVRGTYGTIRSTEYGVLCR